MIGVLALQGAFQKHLDCLQKLSFPARAVKTIEELALCDALILPGGESTAHHKLISKAFWKELQSFAKIKPMMGTCCGLILMAKSLKEDSFPTLGALDVVVSRNAYGPQVESFEAAVEASLEQQVLIKGCFIRAPQIVEVSPKAKVLATYQNKPVIVQQGLAIGCTFHPEIFLDTSLHRYFIRNILKAIA